MARWKCYFCSSSSFRYLSWLLSAAEPPRFRRYRLTYCFAKHGKKRGEERGCEACIKQRLDGDNSGRRSGPGNRVGICVGEE